MKLYFWTEENKLTEKSLNEMLINEQLTVFKHPEAAMKDYIRDTEENGYDSVGRVYIYSIEINPYKAFNVSFKGEPIPWTKKQKHY